MVWAYASASTREDRATFTQPAHDDAQANASAATSLLDMIYMSPTRVEHLDVGVTDLVAAVAAKLELGQPIDRDNAQLLWRLAGRSVGVMPHAASAGVSTTTRGRAR